MLRVPSVSLTQIFGTAHGKHLSCSGQTYVTARISLEKCFSSFCRHTRMSRYPIKALSVRGLGVPPASFPRLRLMKLSTASERRRWLPPSPLLIRTLIPDFFFFSSLHSSPQRLRLGTCGPLPRRNFFTPPPLGRRPNALTQSLLLACGGLPFSPLPCRVCAEEPIHVRLEVKV